MAGSSDWADRLRIGEFIRSPHIRSIGYLASGSAIAQVVGLAVTPVITRLYDPSDYGAVALYAAIVVIVSSIAGGCYETAIPLPKDTSEGEADALALLRVACLVALAVSGVSLMVVLIATMSGRSSWLGDLGNWAYAIPLGVLLSVCSAALSSYATRRREFGRLARIPPTQRIVVAGIQVLGGVLRLGQSGLMIGALATPIIGMRILVAIYREGRDATRNAGLGWGAQRMRSVARRYSDFPRVNLWFALLNAASFNVQSIAVAHFYSLEDVGQYMLAFTTISLPTSLVLTGVSQVYLRECAARTHDRTGALRLARRTLSALLLTSVPIFVGLLLASQFLFGLVFGSDWLLAGAIATAMIPLAWARFLATSLSATFTVYRRLAWLLVWQILSLTLTLLGFIWAGTTGLSITSATLTVSVITAPLYLVLIPMVFVTIRGGPRD